MHKGKTRIAASLLRIVMAMMVACVLSSAANTLRDSASTLALLKQQGSAPMKPKMRTLDELIDKKEPGIEVVREWIHKAKTHIEVLSVDRTSGENALLALQITSRSPMGAI